MGPTPTWKGGPGPSLACTCIREGPAGHLPGFPGPRGLLWSQGWARLGSPGAPTECAELVADFFTSQLPPLPEGPARLGADRERLRRGSSG